MKKILSFITLLLFALGANAQTHLSQSFLNVRSLHVTNGIAFSNIVNFTGMSNIFGTVWTNLSGTRVEVTNAANYTQLAKDVALWANREGLPFTQREPFAAYTLGGTNNFNYTNSWSYPPGPATLLIKMQTGSGANSAVTFVFTPVWDGSTPTTITTDDWSVALTAVASSQTLLATNVPFYRWPGAKSLRLKSIVNGDTDAASGVFVNTLSLNGFVP